MFLATTIFQSLHSPLLMHAVSKLLLVGKLLCLLKVSEHAVLRITVLLKCHSLLHLSNMLVVWVNLVCSLLLC